MLAFSVVQRHYIHITINLELYHFAILTITEKVNERLRYLRGEKFYKHIQMIHKVIFITSHNGCLHHILKHFKFYKTM